MGLIYAVSLWLPHSYLHPVRILFMPVVMALVTLVSACQTIHWLTLCISPWVGNNLWVITCFLHSFARIQHTLAAFRYSLCPITSLSGQHLHCPSYPLNLTQHEKCLTLWFLIGILPSALVWYWNITFGEPGVCSHFMSWSQRLDRVYSEGPW